jgi:hypothetical protein
LQIKGYLVVSHTGQLRVAKRKPSTRAGEIPIELRITVPDKYFDQLAPVVQLTLPEPQTAQAKIEAQIVA